jgi:bifunctional non-homologous end joining protein LigD
VVAKSPVGQAGRFILPSAPVRKAAPPLGPEWIHDIKFDGWRVQLHKDGHSAAVLNRNNCDLTRRFRSVRDSLLALPAHSAIIDGKLVACDNDGKPDFKALMGQNANVCVWCFDLMALDGRDVRQLPLVERRVVLRGLLSTPATRTCGFPRSSRTPSNSCKCQRAWAWKASYRSSLSSPTSPAGTRVG